jgi:CMP-N-acetylneuraminic acid synthetase
LSEILALIPARGGSRGILHKNSRFLNGKPLVQWTVEAAKQSKYLTRVVCSSDDLATLDFAESAGAEPLLRPQELADAGIIYNTELHCLSSLAEQGYEPDIFVRLQPTSPLRTADDIDACLWYINEIGEDACVSVCEPTDHLRGLPGNLTVTDTYRNRTYRGAASDRTTKPSTESTGQSMPQRQDTGTTIGASSGHAHKPT